MECADGPLGIFLEVVEKRCVVPVLNTFENRKMQLKKFFYRVEDATDGVRRRISR